MRTPQVGLVALYFDLFDQTMPPSYREEKEQLARQVASIVGKFAEVRYPGLIANAGQAKRAGAELADKDLDAILVYPTMAAPPGFAWDAVAALNAPILVWNGHTVTRVRDEFDMQDATRHSHNVGTVMVTNVLRRFNRKFHLFTGPVSADSSVTYLHDYLTACAAANRLRRARIGRIGMEIPGYVDVAIDPGELRRSLGAEVIDISLDEWQRTFDDVTPEAVRSLAAGLRGEYSVELSSEPFERSCRIALAMQDLVVRHVLSAGTVNCHSEFFRRNPDVGIVACLGVSWLTGEGVPFSCTGDVPTSIAMLLLKSLGLEAQYAECDMTDYERDFILFTNCGEGDPRICASGAKKRLLPNVHYSGLCGEGACLYFEAATGPATMCGFSPDASVLSGFSLAIAEGELCGTRHPRLGVPNNVFRFRNSNAVEGFNRWCQAGATHHCAVSLGDQSRKLRLCGELLGIDVTVV